MSLETEITALRVAVERLAELPAALDRLTQAVHGHAATRLAIFERAGQEALAAIPLVPGEDAAAVIAEYAVPFTQPTAASTPPPWLRSPVNQTETAHTPASQAEVHTPVSQAEVQQVATEMIRSNERALLQDILVNRIGVANIAQLTEAQRITFMELAHDAGWLPRTEAPETVVEPKMTPLTGAAEMPPAANQPADEPPPVTISYDQARGLGLALLKTGQKAALQDILVNQLGAGSIDQLTDAQRVTFAALVNGALREAA